MRSSANSRMGIANTHGDYTVPAQVWVKFEYGSTRKVDDTGGEDTSNSALTAAILAITPSPSSASSGMTNY